MRFTPDEAAVFLNQMMGLGLKAEEIAALEARTEGWIAGLQLAALSMQGRSDLAGFVRGFTGSHVFIAEYLVEEVLQRQSETLQSFLLQTSIVDRLNAGLCEAVTGRQDGQATLNALQRANLFLIALDDHAEWFRYHHLFADLLRAHLQQALSPDEVIALHRRAADWYQRQGFVVEDEGEELFKSMTAHGGVSMWLKYRDERSENLWQPKLMFATNNRMHYGDQSGALTRRLVVIECPNSLPDYRLDGALLQKLTPELGAFAVVCIRLALDAQNERSYPESDAMRELLTDIEMNGDAAKLWLAENCIYDSHAFESIQTLYANFRFWCGENGLYPVSRPKLRDAITGFWPGIVSTKRRVYDAVTGEIKPMWGLAGIRLRRDDDPDEDLSDSCSTVPDCSTEEMCHGSSDIAKCSGVPSDSENYSAIQTDSPDLQIVEEGEVPTNSWNTILKYWNLPF